MAKKDLRLVLFDRDNTLVALPKERRYVFGDDPVEIFSDAPSVLATLRRRGIFVAVVSNQRGVSLPEYPLMTLDSVACFNRRMNEELARRNSDGVIDSFYVCPHDLGDNCSCRKPRPGLIVQAMEDFSVLPCNTIVIGDSPTDIQAAYAANVESIMICRSKKSQLIARESGWRWASSLSEALDEFML